MFFEKLDYDVYQYVSVALGDDYKYLCVCPKYKVKDGDEVIVKKGDGTEEKGVVLDTLYTSNYDEKTYQFFIDLLSDHKPLKVIARVDREDFNL